METFEYKGKQRKRKNVVITLDPELVKKARKLGLNISKICENTLIQAVKALEQVFDENKGGNLGTVGSGLVRGGGI
ncbi:type II toxin-antitoxin system CcdA family antitoxin [Candidatus Bathyarchaeota archaeon]|nr:type II toxin-antitoxin system CcdA family antitoxin [Candidatus Bathyarchaeota archaeon]